MVEVNNTFGERHCYLLDRPVYGMELRAAKVFHVSPFCAVEGDYRFRFFVDDSAHAHAWCASTTTTPTARCCRPASAARLEPFDARQRAARALALSGDDASA